MTMTISEALSELTDLDNAGVIRHETYLLIRSRLEVGDGRVLKTPGEVYAWFAGFAACSGRDVPDDMVDRASKAYNATLFTSSATHEQAMKAALVAALGDGK